LGLPVCSENVLIAFLAPADLPICDTNKVIVFLAPLGATCLVCRACNKSKRCEG
jgi:hypothetical protein